MEDDRQSQGKNDIRATSGKEIKKHLWAFLLVAFGVILYIALNNLGAIGGAIKTIITVLSPLLIGALIALILNSPMNAIKNLILKIGGAVAKKKEKDYKPNKRAIDIVSLVITVLLALLLIYIIVYSIVPQLIESVKSLFGQIQKKLPEMLKFLDKVDEYGINTDGIRNWLSSLDFSALMSKITDNAGNIIDKVISSASSIISGTFTAITSIVFALYVLATKETLSYQLKKLGYAYLKKETVEKFSVFASTTAETFSNFISGQCLDAVILGLMCLVTMWIFGFPYALPIASMITVTAIIPYVGSFLGGAFGFLLIVMVSPVKAFLFILLFILVQQVDNHVIYPRVVGGSVGLPPIWTFIAVIVGGAIMGVLGMVLFIPIFSVIYSLISKSVSKRLDTKGISVEKPEHMEKEDSADKSRFLSWLQGILRKTAEFFRKLFSKIFKKKNNKK